MTPPLHLRAPIILLIVIASSLVGTMIAAARVGAGWHGVVVRIPFTIAFSVVYTALYVGVKLWRERG